MLLIHDVPDQGNDYVARDYDFLATITSEEMELLDLLSLHTDFKKYDDPIEQFRQETIVEPTSAAWLTAVQQKQLKELYQKFVDNYDFGY